MRETGFFGVCLKIAKTMCTLISMDYITICNITNTLGTLFEIGKFLNDFSIILL